MQITVVLFIFSLGCLSLLNLAKEYAYEKASMLFQQTNQDNSQNGIFSINLAEQLTNISSGILSSNSSKKLYIDYLVRISGEIKNTQQKIDLYCKAFEVSSSLKAAEPRNARTLLNWLHWQQILQNTSCSNKLTNDERQALVSQTINLDPNNPQILYQTALLLIWSEQKNLALPLFRRVIELSSSLSAGHEQEILRLINKPTDIEAIIPAKFPQITNWSKMIREQRSALFNSASETIRALQIAALENSLATQASGQTPPRIHLTNMTSLWQEVADDSVRQKIDQYISIALGETTSLGSYLMKRASMKISPIITAHYHYDSQPQRNSFSSWNSTKLIYLDSAYSSIGFYKPLKLKPKLIEMHFMTHHSAPPLNSITVLTSIDNTRWETVKFNAYYTNNPNLTGSWVIIEPQSDSYKYLKINYQSTNRSNKLGNIGDQIIKVYQ